MVFWFLQHRFQPQNPLSAAQPFSSREVGGEEEELRLSSHTLLLPTRGQLEARMMVTAFELGLDNITEDAVSTMVYAVEVCSIYASSTVNWPNHSCPPRTNGAIRGIYCFHSIQWLMLVRWLKCSFQGGCTFINTSWQFLHSSVDLFQHHLKDVLTSVITRRKAYRLRDGHFPYAFGSDITPQPYLKNSLTAYHNVIEW